MKSSRTPTIHWSTVSRNPISPAALASVHEQLASTQLAPLPSYVALMEENLTGKSVLDIGVVEHTREFIERPNWKHAIIKRMAARVVGCDILAEEVEYLASRGFDVRLVDATSDVDLGERFEVVYIGDVIEHVNRPVDLLRFARRHLAPGGAIIVTTPCPYWFKNLWKIAREGFFVGNVDHISWVTPFNALELGARANLQLRSWHLVQNLGSGPVSRLIHRLRRHMRLGRNELFSWAYAYIFSAQEC